MSETNRLAILARPNVQATTFSCLANFVEPHLQTIHHTASGGATLSKFDYSYDTVGNIRTWRQERTGRAAFSYQFSYDAADQIVAAVKQSTDPTPTVLTRHAWAYDVAGNRTTAQMDDA